MPRPFLTARWQDLALITYTVEPALLLPHLPPGLTLDEHPHWPGAGLVSLVAFDFRDCRVMGVRWRVPFTRLVDFPEINLRFYVRGPRGRGVCFIREFVSSRLIALAAKWIYNEPYAAATMTSRVTYGEGPSNIIRRVSHEIDYRGTLHRIDVAVSAQTWMPGPDSVEHFFKEHQWGYGIDRRGRTLTYEVRHHEWAVNTVNKCEVNVNFGQLYGPQWADLASTKPISTVLAVGSAVEVYPYGTER